MSPPPRTAAGSGSTPSRGRVEAVRARNPVSPPPGRRSRRPSVAGPDSRSPAREGQHEEEDEVDPARGAKKSATSQSGQPASRSRRTVNARPTDEERQGQREHRAGRTPGRRGRARRSRHLTRECIVHGRPGPAEEPRGQQVVQGQLNRSQQDSGREISRRADYSIRIPTIATTSAFSRTSWPALPISSATYTPDTDDCSTRRRNEPQPRPRINHGSVNYQRFPRRGMSARGWRAAPG